ncbi:RNA polymerase sigma-70 factor [Pedobacter sp. PLR]|uniref:RNA polymerase sigma-70 factor n=1 Tax=Pedobacter sp. PLR TaxID=2994465 RepID=UPI0022479FD8|nr:RNA polymerase sigma-70 factor [Pedobacter sp. PLR]MCX2450518.1 RNA polymerase sigma-70 factor [Pedobacter sp. PLR]
MIVASIGSMALKRIENESAVLQQISEGCEQSFGVLFYHYLPVLQSFALKFTRSTEAAEEVIQEAFVRIWLNRDRLDEVENIQAYLYKFVSNECLSYLRKALRQEKAMDEAKNVPLQPLNNETMESVHFNELKGIIARAVETLSPQRKTVYQLSRLEGLSIPEISEKLNLSQNTVKNTLITALKCIRANLIANGIELSLLFLLFWKK